MNEGDGRWEADERRKAELISRVDDGPAATQICKLRRAKEAEHVDSFPMFQNTFLFSNEFEGKWIKSHRGDLMAVEKFLAK